MRKSEQWFDAAACRSTPSSVFFPSDAAGVAVAQRICRTCPVQQQCLEYALRNYIDDGIWGGESERSRQKLRRLGRLGNNPVIPKAS